MLAGVIATFMIVAGDSGRLAVSGSDRLFVFGMGPLFGLAAGFAYLRNAPSR